MEAARLPQDQMHKKFMHVAQHPAYIAILDQIPNMALLLTKSRQIVHGNKATITNLGLKNIKKALGLRPGELFQCVHAKNSGSCGDATGCRYCGAVLAVIESQNDKRQVVKEARVTVQPHEHPLSMDIRVTAQPFRLESEKMTLVFFEDISAQKRRECLEAIFYHDANNTLNALSLLTEFAPEATSLESLKEDVAVMRQQVGHLIDDLSGHKILMEAEEGRLTLRKRSIPLSDLLDSCIRSVSGVAERSQVNLGLDLKEAPDSIVTDTAIARRILVNGLKNAIEACSCSETVSLTVEKPKEGFVLFTINNPGFISEDVREQIFQRSFSTKGKGRGLGTYSMRLLLETYLGGEIVLSTSRVAGTTFQLYFPVGS